MNNTKLSSVTLPAPLNLTDLKSVIIKQDRALVKLHHKINMLEREIKESNIRRAFDYNE